MTTRSIWRGDAPLSLGWFPLALLFTALMLAACSSSSAPAANTPSISQNNAAPAGLTANPTTAPPQPSTALPTETPSLAVIDNEFHPSNPATVSLAAGRPQFVEFFAFW
jgi:hypothetical protein